MPKEERRNFEYRGRSQEEVARRSKQNSGSYDNYIAQELISYKPKEGDNCIRLLPWNIGQKKADSDKLAEKWGDHWGVDVYVHYNVGPDEQSYLCLDKMLGQPCPVCEARREGDEAEQDALRINNRILCWLIDRNDEKAGPKYWVMPLGASKDISAVSVVKGSGEVLMIDDPEEGFDIYFEREGEKKRTKYKRFEVARDPTPLHEKGATMDRWLGYIADHVLPEQMTFFESDHIEKVLFGKGRKEAGEEETTTERPSRRGRAAEEPEEGSRPSRRSREPEPEEETRPARRGRAAEPEEEEPAPRPSRRRAAEETEENPPSESRSSRRSSRSEPEETSQDYDHEAEEAAQSNRRGGTQTRRRAAEEEPSEETPRGRRRAAEEEEAPEPRGGRSERTERASRRRSEPEEEAPEEEEGARGRLKRLGQRGK